MDKIYKTYPDLAKAIITQGSEEFEELYDSADRFLTYLSEFNESLNYFKQELAEAGIGLKE